MGRHLVGLGLAVALSLVAGCGDDAPPAADAPPHADAAAVEAAADTEAAPDVAAKQALRKAVRRLMRANTGHVEITAPGSAAGATQDIDYLLQPGTAPSACVPGRPAAVVAARYGVGHSLVDASTIRGTTDLAIALSLLGAGATTSDLALLADTTVPVTFALHDGVLSGYTIEMADLAEIAGAAGADAGAAGPADRSGRISVAFTGVGRPGPCG